MMPPRRHARQSGSHEKVDVVIVGQTTFGKRRGLKKIDGKTMEFTVQIPPDSEKGVTYKVHYSW